MEELNTHLQKGTKQKKISCLFQAMILYFG